LAPTTYRIGRYRWLYFIDRGQNNPRMNLRDLALLPCGPEEIEHLYCITLGINNAPGATAAGTTLMREFGLSIKCEYAYDSRSGDIGSKTCAVIFPADKSPRDFDDFVARQVSRGRPGCHLIRKASEKQVEVHGSYSSDAYCYFGLYAQIRRFLPHNIEPKAIDKIEIQGEPATIHETPLSMSLRLTSGQVAKVDRFLAAAYGDEHRLEGRFVQVSCDNDFEALTFSFLDPDDILCWISLQFRGDTDEVNKVVKWLGERGVDFRQYQIVEDESESGYEFRLLCDLAQTDLHLFDRSTLQQLLFAELDRRLSSGIGESGSQLRSLDVVFENETLTLYNKFTERHRFRLLAVLYLDSGGIIVRSWPKPDDGLSFLEEIVNISHSVSFVPTTVQLEKEVSVVMCRSPRGQFTVAVVYGNQAPRKFENSVRHLCQQPMPEDNEEAVTRAVRKHLLLGLNYALLPREKFEALGELGAEAFRRENDERFSSLGWSYIVEKWERDKFAFRGNLALASMLGTYLGEQEEVRRRLTQPNDLNRVRILDIGPGVGALTTALAIRNNAILWDNLDRIDLVFLDTAQRVLDLNREGAGYRELPPQLLEDLQFAREDELERFVGLLRRSTYLCKDIASVSVEMLKREIGIFDLIYSGFCHHHMNLAMKTTACQAMVGLARDYAFVGVVDESLSYKQYLLYRIGHSLDHVGVATESYLRSAREHSALFGERLEVKGRREGAGNKFYAFWGKVNSSERLILQERQVQPRSKPRRQILKREEDVATMLRDLDRLSLSESVVVGRYLRHNQQARNLLTDWARRITHPLLTKTVLRENFLVWAAPGSGKTFLVQQIVAELGGAIDFVECNLAKEDKESFSKKLNRLTNRSLPVLCLIDEIDARGDEAWPYEVCFPHLDLNLDTSRQAVFVLIGSTQSSAKTMAEAMGKRHKGPDLLSRILLPQNSFEIPSPTQEDNVVMVIGEIVHAIGPRIKAVEKLALFYILTNEDLRYSPRRLSEFVKSAAQRFQKDDDRLRFLHLFRRDDDEVKFDFWKAHEGSLEGLSNVNVVISA